MQQYTIPKTLEHEAYRINPTIPIEGEKKLSESISIHDTASIPPINDYQINDARAFKVNNRATNQNYEINAILLYDGTHSQIWVHDNSITQDKAIQLGQEFDNNIYIPIVNAFGEPSDIDGNGKVSILCYDIQDNYRGAGSSYVGGYFNGNDLLNNNVSNRMELFYIDTYPSMGTDKNNLDVSKAYSTLAHEFQHMINFNHDWFSEGNRQDNKTLMETWLNEGLSMAAEQLYLESALTSRINYYNKSTSIKNGHSLLNWDANGDVLSNYSLSYLFMQYLRIQANQGYINEEISSQSDKLYKEIIGHQKGNYEAVEAVIKKYIDPNMSFNEFMTAFRIAMVVKADTGLYGFGGETGFNDLATQLYNGSTKNISGGSAIVVAPGTNGLDDTVEKGENVTYTGIIKKN